MCRFKTAVKVFGFYSIDLDLTIQASAKITLDDKLSVSGVQNVWIQLYLAQDLKVNNHQQFFFCLQVFFF